MLGECRSGVQGAVNISAGVIIIVTDSPTLKYTYNKSMQRYYRIRLVEMYMYDSKSVTDFGSKIAKQISAGGLLLLPRLQLKPDPTHKKKEKKLERRKICI